MAAMTNYLENKLLDHVLRGVVYNPPTTTYVALLTSAPDDTNAITEVSGGGYARVPIQSNTINWSGTQGAGSNTASTGTSGTTSNNTVIRFGTPTGSWGNVVGVVLMDSSVGGNALIQGSLTEPVAVGGTDPAPSFPIGTFSFQIDN